jgi:hypothetical protein
VFLSERLYSTLVRPPIDARVGVVLHFPGETRLQVTLVGGVTNSAINGRLEHLLDVIDKGPRLVSRLKII